MTQTPDNPAGEFESVENYCESARAQRVQDIMRTPGGLRKTVMGLTEPQLNTRYRNWTIRQIVHHLADSHAHSYIRFKWALTESNPLIKAYEEADWVALDDCVVGSIDPPLAMLDGIHAKWAQLLQSLTPQQYSRTFVHPQTRETVSLWTALNYYSWHGKHHTAQIHWLCDANDW